MLALTKIREFCCIYSWRWLISYEMNLTKDKELTEIMKKKKKKKIIVYYKTRGLDSGHGKLAITIADQLLICSPLDKSRYLVQPRPIIVFFFFRQFYFVRYNAVNHELNANMELKNGAYVCYHQHTANLALKKGVILLPPNRNRNSYALSSTKGRFVMHW